MIGERSASNFTNGIKNYLEKIEENHQLNSQLINYAKNYSRHSPAESNKVFENNIIKETVLSSCIHRFKLLSLQIRDKLNYRTKRRLQGMRHPD